jgi:hypothetical protein
MALTLILLVAAGLVGKSFYHLLRIDPGFRTEGIVAMELSLPNPGVDEERYQQFMQSYQRLMEQGIAPDTTVRSTRTKNDRDFFKNNCWSI